MDINRLLLIKIIICRSSFYELFSWKHCNLSLTNLYHRTRTEILLGSSSLPPELSYDECRNWGLFQVASIFHTFLKLLFCLPSFFSTLSLYSCSIFLELSSLIYKMYFHKVFPYIFLCFLSNSALIQVRALWSWHS